MLLSQIYGVAEEDAITSDRRYLSHVFAMATAPGDQESPESG